MSVGQDGAYDFLLQDTEANPKIELGMVLAPSETGTKSWAEGRIPPIPPRRSSGTLDWTHKDPIADFVFAQDNWQDGAFEPYYSINDPNRYAKSDGVDLRWKGVAALGARRLPIRSSGTVKSKLENNLFIANGDAEEGQAVGWSAGTGATYTINTTSVRSGTYDHKVVVAQGTAAGDILTQAFANPTVWQSREVTVIAYVRRSAGSDAGIFMRLDDGVATQDSSAITSSTYAYISATITVNAAAAALTIRFRHDATTSTDAHTFFIDDVHVIPTGGVECVGSAIIASASPQDIYAAVGRCVLKWNESTFVWEAVYVNASATATDIIEYINKIYVAFGEANGATPHQYIYGTNTTWTTAAINATTTHHDNHARFWVKARNGFGQWVLWKAGPSTNQGTERNRLAWASDPDNTGTWSPSTYFSVGSSSRKITALHAWRDTLVVAKEDGLWIWDGIINDFAVVTEEWEKSADPLNGKVGAQWHGDLYVAAVQQGFFRFAGEALEELQGLITAPRLTDFGGRVTAMLPLSKDIVLALDTPDADTNTAKTARLVRMRLAPSNRWQLHTVAEPSIALIDELVVHRGTRLWAFGRTYDSNLSDYIPRCSVWDEPSKTAAPYAAASPAIESTGYFDTSIWHGNTPETDKAFIALTIWGEDLDANHTIQVSYGRDGRASNTRVLGTFNGTDRIQTLLFKNVLNPKENAIGRFIQLRFTFSTTDTTSPKMYAFALHTQLVPPPIRVFQVEAFVGSGTLLRTEVQHEKTKSEIEAIFEELENQVFPITLIDDFGQTHGGEGTNGARVRQVRLTNFSRVPETDADQGQERWRLTLQEVAIT